MSTRSAIIMKTQEGYAGIYCHFDGYESGVGQTLLDHYSGEGKASADKVASLIALGDISVLDRRVEPTGPHQFSNRETGTTLAYHRDRGEDWDDVKPVVGPTAQAVAKQIGHNGYVYVFEDGRWTCNGREAVEGAFVNDDEDK